MAECMNWMNGSSNTPFPGITSERVDLGNMTIVNYRFEPHASFPAHRHPEEQVVIVLSGTCTMEAGGHTYELTAGSMVVNPSMEWHSITSGDDGVAFLNLITPRRSGNTIEYLK